jgi:O-succinylhomoserine sulfhydrylase
MKKKLRFETSAVRIQARRSGHKEHSVPIFETSSFVFDSADEAEAVFADQREGNMYSRFSNPNSDEFISKLCALEDAEDGIATASGMAAIFLTMAALLRPGDHLLVNRRIFGTTHLLITQILSKWGISHTYVNTGDKQEWEEGLLPITRMIYGNALKSGCILDWEGLGNFSGKTTFTWSLLFCYPIPAKSAAFRRRRGHSFSRKFIDGQAAPLWCDSGSKEIITEIRRYRGSLRLLCPFHRLVALQSLETLGARMIHC